MQFTEKLSSKMKVFSFIATCMVVVYHSPAITNDLAINSSDAFINEYLIKTIKYSIGFAMSYFFSVTSFLLFNNLTIKTYKKKIKSRVFTLLVPYVAWQMICMLAKIITDRSLNSVWFIIKTAFLCNPIDYPLWYLYVVFLLAILSPILLLVFKKKKIGFICILMLYLLSLFVISIKKFPNSILQNAFYTGYLRNIFYYSPAYLLGAFYGRFHEEIKGKEYLIYMLIFLIVGLVFYNVFPEIPIICQLLPLLCLFELPLKNNYKYESIFKLTFLIYAIHGPLILAVDDSLILFLTKLNISSTVSTVILKIICLALVFLVSWIVYYILNRYSKKTLELITGGRK